MPHAGDEEIVDGIHEFFSARVEQWRGVGGQKVLGIGKEIAATVGMHEAAKDGAAFKDLLPEIIDQLWG
jgi:hypothetical protein